jgi:hypothetical protein
VFGPCRRAKRLCASSSGVSGPFDEVDHRVAQPWITSHAPPLESHLGLDTSCLEVPRGLEQRKTFFRLIGCQDTVGGMGLEAVVPIPEAVEPGLHGVGHRQQGGSASPSFDVAKDPLDLRVEVPGPDLAADVGDPQLPHRCAKSPPELAPVIGHEEPGSLCRFVSVASSTSFARSSVLAGARTP